jgi:hypothetical protein
MATCAYQDVLTDACSSGFLAIAQDEVQFRKLSLALLQSANGSTYTYEELLEQACSSGFLSIAQSEEQFRKLLLQLLCNSV